MVTPAGEMFHPGADLISLTYRSGIENVNSVEALQETLIRALRSLITRNHANESAIFTKLLLKLPDLRSLNNMHSEQLLAFKVHS
ncbi:Nuclear receptor subfamily 1 group D member 2 [Ameca splendens]|uniref:Nuclear receptor subfamily 1 group D member 2 n=1 Tax=Ameca splendens TaxID=208324 RepID=A0ABV0Z6W4_9TELE